jgi:hypothetical protein
VKATSEKANVTASPINVVGISEASSNAAIVGAQRDYRRVTPIPNSSSSEADITRLV